MYLNDAVQEKGIQSFILFLAIPWNRSFGSLFMNGLTWFFACGTWVTQKEKKEEDCWFGRIWCFALGSGDDMIRKLSLFASFCVLGWETGFSRD